MRFVLLTLGAGAPLLALASPALAAQSYVGTCGPGSATTFPTITAAVTQTGAPGTVFICPGVYKEQIVLTKPLSLRGVTTPSSSAVVLAPPDTGLAANATSVFSATQYAAQIVVSGVTGVTLAGLTVDGSNNQVTSCEPVLTGILLQNSSATLLNLAVVNHVQPVNDGCQSGLAIYAQNDGTNGRTLSVRNSYVANYQKNGITGNGSKLTVTVSGNTVVGRGPTTGAANNGIQIGFGATGTISGNQVSDDVWAPDTASDPGDAAAGILVYASQGVAVSKNTVANTQYGIAIEGDGTRDNSSDNAAVTGNRVGATHIFDGVDVCGSNGVLVQNDVVYGSDEAGIHIDSACGGPSTGASVTGNTVNGACAGILLGAGSNPVAGTNTIVNATIQVLSGSDVCPAVGGGGAFAPRGGTRHHASPVR